MLYPCLAGGGDGVQQPRQHGQQAHAVPEVGGGRAADRKRSYNFNDEWCRIVLLPVTVTDVGEQSDHGPDDIVLVVQRGEQEVAVD